MELALSEMDGPEFYEWLSVHRPELVSRVIVMTASQEREEFRRFLEEFAPPVVHKPPSRDALIAAVSKLSREASEQRAATP
jgi:DNA-binding NarL/FixJ family response regulator